MKKNIGNNYFRKKICWPKFRERENVKSVRIWNKTRDRE